MQVSNFIEICLHVHILCQMLYLLVFEKIACGLPFYFDNFYINQ